MTWMPQPFPKSRGRRREMPLFDKKNNTVSDKQRADLNRRAAKQSWTDKKAVDRRKASEVQRKKSRWS